MATLVQSYKDEEMAANATDLVIGPFTPSVGELLVIKFINAEAGQQVSTPVVSGFTTTTVTSRINVGTASASCRCAIFTCAVTASAEGSVTVSVTSGTTDHAAVVERWSEAQLDATPVTASTVADATTPWNTTITTEAAGSVVTYVCGDWSGADPAGVAFAGDTATPTQEQAASYRAGNMTGYWLYQAAASAGDQTIGLSAPTGQSLTTAALELQTTVSPVTVVVPSILVDVTLHE